VELRRTATAVIARKEFLKIRRDRRTLAVIVVLPIMMLLIYGFGIRYDVRSVGMAVLNFDRSPASADFLDRFFRSGYFARVSDASSYAELERALDSGRARLGLVIPPEFGRRIPAGESVKVQVVVDGTDNNTASIALGYFGSVAQSYSVEMLLDRMRRTSYPLEFEIPALDLVPRVWYNPDLESSHWVVPGIIAIIMMMVGAILTALTIVQEKESGSMEQLIVSPVRPVELILGKLIPYIVIAMADMLVIIAVAFVVFGVPIKGSFPLLVAMGFLYLTNVLGLGVVVSTLTSTVQSAMTAAMTMTLLPSILLSGFIFPIENMPWILQAFSTIVPARYFLRIIRGIYLKGTGLETFWPDAAFLVLFSVLMVTISTLRMKKRLD
jgi:ABC-2 type transport system permease protein